MTFRNVLHGWQGKQASSFGNFRRDRKANNPTIIANGNIFNVDAGNPKSYTGSGTTWTDLSGNAYDGTLTNGATFDRVNDGTIVFDGVNDFVTVPSLTTPFASVSEFTYSGWVKFVGSQQTSFSGCAFFSVGNTNSFTTDILVAWDKGGSGTFFAQVNNGADGQISFSGTNTGLWMNLAVVYNGNLTTNSDRLKFYVNGVEKSVTVGYTIPATTSTLRNLCYIGTYASFPSNWYLNGSISQTSVYNRALSSSEISQNFNAMRARYGV
jgi:hypothetical protein